MSSGKEILEERFYYEYNRLNERQREAVDTIEGPVMVLAGPGTGKTQILACRIGKILLETDTSPQNILCLTYTDAGVVAMRKRLVSLIGSVAYKVHVHTFHSFCNSVIQENIRLFNNKEMEPLNDLERVQLIKQLIDEFEEGNPLKRYKGEIYYDLKSLATLYSNIKREGWDMDWLIGKIEEYVTDIVPETDSFYRKREKKKGIIILTKEGEAEVQRMEKLKAAVRSFSRYQEIMTQKRRYDYDDMINWVIKIFDTNPDLLLGYQERMQYILVDEYQDTSGSQNRIVEQLTSYWAGEKPNLFVVGDDDQSIYRFQGANLKNLMTLATKFEKDLVKIVLTENYRSVQPILDIAKALIENNKQRLVNEYPDLSKELIAANTEIKDLHIVPEIHIYENEFCENAGVVSQIKALVDSGVHPGSIAVIYREHKFGDEFIKFLQLQHIPFFVKRSHNLLEDVFINKVLNFIRYIVAEQDTPFSGEPILFELLHQDFFEISPFRIATICNEIAGNGNRSSGPSTLRDYLQRLQPEQTGTLFAADPKFDELARVGAMLERLHQEAANYNIQQWFDLLVTEAGILSYIMKQDEKFWLMEKLSSLYDYIKEESHRDPGLSLKKLLFSFELMKENDLSLTLIQTTGSENGVNLITCHGSKGLEFEYVFFIGARNDVWEGKTKVNKGFRLPPNVFERESHAEFEEEQRRLFFVSITRAEKFLFISYPAMTNAGKDLIPSQFTEEISIPLGIEPRRIQLGDEEKLYFQSLRFGIVQKPVMEQVEKEYINVLLNKFVMNVTALNNYLECPLKFYYNNLIRVPSAKSESAQFGIAVHAALSDFNMNMMDNGRVYPDKSYLLSRFAYHINNGREVFTKESLKRFSEHGKNVLSAYYEKYYVPSPKGDFISTEFKLTNIVVRDIPLKGFIDKIQFWGNDIVVTDYKTGSYSKAKARKEFDKPGTNEKVPHGGNYWRQGVFYKVLIDQYPGKNWNVLHTQFDFIEPNSDGSFDQPKFPITAEEKEQVIEQIKTVWEKIRQHDFYTGCGKEGCEWCGFVKNNKLYLRIEEEAPEE